MSDGEEAGTIVVVDPDFDLDAFRELPKREQIEKYGPLLIDRLEADGKLKVRDLERRTPQRRLGRVDEALQAAEGGATEASD